MVCCLQLVGSLTCRCWTGLGDLEDMVEWKGEAIVAVKLAEANENGRSVGGGRQPSQRFPSRANQRRILD